MKRISSYGLLIVALILSIAVASSNVWEKKLLMEESQLIDPLHPVSTPLEKDYSFTSLDMLFVPVGLTNVSSIPRLPVTAVKTGNNLYLLLNYCFSQLTCQQFYTTKSTYDSHYSKKGSDGYYIYALRKLLI